MDDLETKLNKLRASIDAVDDKILALICERAHLATKVGEAKHNTGNAPFYVPSREASIIRRLLSQNDAIAKSSYETKIPDAAIHGIYREIIAACLALEHPMTIAYLGPEGTFSHTASTRQFGAIPKYLACASLAMVFDEVESGRAVYGVVPVENAFEGAVTPTLDLFANMERNVFICTEVKLTIHHHLFSYASNLDDVEVVISHPQPLGQCSSWIESHLPNARLMESSSTVRAAQIVDEAKINGASALDWKKCAVIGPYSIVDQSDLPLVQRNIEDFHDNTTRFFVIGQHDSPASGEDKTSLVMSIKDEPGALHKLISSFAKRGIGLTRIESRPSKKRLWQYVFFADIEGHRNDVNVSEAIAEIRSELGGIIKVLGSYPVSRPL